MPSTLQGTTRRRRSRLLGDSSGELSVISTPQVEAVDPPWGGYVPDLDPELTTYQDALDCRSIVARGGQLMMDDGYERIDPNRLPLGGASLVGNPNLTFADANPDTILRSAGNWITDGFVIGQRIEVSDSATNDGTFQVDALTATLITLIVGDTLTAEGPSADIMVSALPPSSVVATLTGNPALTFADANPDTILRAAGSWITDGFAGGQVIGVTGSASNNDSFTIASLTATLITLIASDTLVAEGPTANITVTATSSGAGEAIAALPQHNDNAAVQHRFAITSDENLGHLYELVSSIWTNRAYTNTVAGSVGISGDPANPERTLFDWVYYPLGDFLVFTNDLDNVYKYPDTGSTTSYTEFNAFQFAGANATFRARSVTSYADRVVFLNTVEGLSEFPFRLRWTNISSNPTLDPEITGTGFVDLIEVEGQGLKVMPLGNDAMACYFDNGVVLVRRVFVATQAFSREFVTIGRGLLSSFSVVDLGSGVHFGIFTDGWFFFDATGRWIEAGVRNINGKINHKWKETFYNQLNFDNRDRVVLGLDRTNRFVRISFPTQESPAAGTNVNPDTVWIYDLEQDAVWPDIYPGSQTPNIWGNFDDQVADTAWDDFLATDTWNSSSATWNEFGLRTGRERPTHGSIDGFVFRHSQNLFQRDGTSPSYLWETHVKHRGLPSLMKNTDRLHMSYKRLTDQGGGNPPPVTFTLKSEDARTDTPITQNKGADGTLQIDYVDARQAGNRLGFGVSGQGPVRISSFQFQYIIHGLQEKKD